MASELWKELMKDYRYSGRSYVPQDDACKSVFSGMDTEAVWIDEIKQFGRDDMDIEFKDIRTLLESGVMDIVTPDNIFMESKGSYSDVGSFYNQWDTRKDELIADLKRGNETDNMGMMCDVHNDKPAVAQIQPLPKAEDRSVKTVCQGCLDECSSQQPQRATELEYLKWFHQNADFGPADGDVQDHMQRSFKRHTGKLLPLGYNYDSAGEEKD